MNREEVIGYLESLPRFSDTPGIFREEKLLEYLGNPEKGYPIIHITGTNGKGSTGAMIATVLEMSGLKVGFYTSPHLEDYPERIQCNRTKISWTELGESIDQVRRAAQLMDEQEQIRPTEFDVLTAAGFLFFSQSKVDVAIIEVGIGGTLDSTNVVSPIVSVITNIEEDHLDRCGPTVNDLAEHKAGIIKEGVPVFSSVKVGALREIIRTHAKQLKSESFFSEEDWIYQGRPNLEELKEQLTFCGKGKISKRFDGEYSLSLLGTYQLENGALAVAVLNYLNDRWPEICGNIVRGLNKARWPGRFEVFFRGKQMVIIDGAHNELGANSLKEALDEWFPNKNRHFVVGFLEDKDAKKFLETIYSKNDVIYGVKVDSPRAMTKEKTLELLGEYNSEWFETLEESLENLVHLEKKSIIVVCGSLYLVGPGRCWVERNFVKA